MKRFFSHFTLAEPRAKKRLVPRMFLTFMVCSILGLAATFASIPSAHAQGVCVDDYLASNNVYDSYNHLEGWINLIQDPCSGGIYGAFFGNNNTWKSVTVYVEYSYQYGYLVTGPVGWSANAGVWSPPYYGSNCYYAEVNLWDNRGVHNWVGTSNVCV